MFQVASLAGAYVGRDQFGTDDISSRQHCRTIYSPNGTRLGYPHLLGPLSRIY